jgi:hypothetical protein
MQEILITMEEALINELWMKVNTKKTKFLLCSKNSYTEIKIYLERNFKIEQVENFTHLESIISADGRSKKEIIKRICQAKIAFNQKKKATIIRNISPKIRNNLLYTFVWTIMLYVRETWTIGKGEQRRIEAFELWHFRRMLKISWRDNVTDEEVIERIMEKKSPLALRKGGMNGLVMYYGTVGYLD